MEQPEGVKAGNSDIHGRVRDTLLLKEKTITSTEGDMGPFRMQKHVVALLLQGRQAR